MRLTIAEQMARLKIQPSRQRQSLYNLSFHSALNLGNDGEDHINFSEHGKTKLGRALCHTTGLPINHPIFGRFKTMTGFWNFILSPNKDDELRTLVGRPLHSLVNRLTRAQQNIKDKSEHYHVRNFRAIILDTYYVRAMSSPEIKQLLIDCDLEFDSYYIQSENGLRMRYRNFKWFIPMLNELRSAIQENREPDYELFMSDPEVGIYHDVIPLCVSETMEARRLAKEERKRKLALAREARILKEHIDRDKAAAEAAEQSALAVQTASEQVLTATYDEWTMVPGGIIVDGVTPIDEPVAETTEVAPEALSVHQEDPEENWDDGLPPEEPTSDPDEFVDMPVEETEAPTSVAETVRRVVQSQQELGTLGQELMSLVK